MLTFILATAAAKMIYDENVKLAIQVNGKLRAVYEIPSSMSKDEALKTAKELENVRKYLEGKQIVKEIYIPKRLISFVVVE